MSQPYVLLRRDTRRTWVWLALSIITFAALLTMLMLPSATGDDEVGERSPGLHPQSNTRPMPPPSVARMRGLAA